MEFIFKETPRSGTLSYEGQNAFCWMECSTELLSVYKTPTCDTFWPWYLVVLKNPHLLLPGLSDHATEWKCLSAVQQGQYFGSTSLCPQAKPVVLISTQPSEPLREMLKNSFLGPAPILMNQNFSGLGCRFWWLVKFGKHSSCDFWTYYRSLHPTISVGLRVLHINYLRWWIYYLPH